MIARNAFSGSYKVMDGGNEGRRRECTHNFCPLAWHRACNMESTSNLTIRLPLAVGGMPIHRGDDLVVTRNRKIRQPKDAIALLKADHHKVRQLFQEYEIA